MSFKAIILADISKYQSEIDKAVKTSKNASKDIEKNFGKLDGVFTKVAKGATLMAGAFVGVAAAAIKLGMDAGDAASEINNLSTATGISTDTLQELKYVADTSNSSFDGLKRSLESFNKTMRYVSDDGSTVSKTLRSIGVETRNLDGSLRTTEDVFLQTLTALSELPEGIEKIEAGGKIFKTSWNDVSLIISSGAEGIKKLREEARELNLVMSKDSLNAADNFGTSMYVMQERIKTLGVQLGAELAPTLESTVLPIIEQDLMPLLRDVVIPGFVKLVEVVGVLARALNKGGPLVQSIAIVGGAMTAIATSTKASTLAMKLFTGAGDIAGARMEGWFTKGKINQIEHARAAISLYQRDMDKLALAFQAGTISSEQYTQRTAILTKAMKDANNAIGYHQSAIVKIGATVSRVMGIVGIAITVITAVISVYRMLTKAQREAINESAEMSLTLASEQTALNKLKTEYDDSNTSLERKKEIMGELESKYGAFLTDLKNEKGEVTKVAEAWERANDAIVSNTALKAQNIEVEKVAEKYLKKATKAIKTLQDGMKNATEEEKIQMSNEIASIFESKTISGISAYKAAIDVFLKKDMEINRSSRIALLDLDKAAKERNKELKTTMDRYGSFIKESVTEGGSKTVSTELEEAYKIITQLQEEIARLKGTSNSTAKSVKSLADELSKLDENGFKEPSAIQQYTIYLRELKNELETTFGTVDGTSMFEELNKLEAPSINLDKKTKSFDELKERIKETSQLEAQAQAQADIAYQRSIAIRSEANRLLAIAETERSEASIDLAVSAEKAAREAEKQAENLAKKWRLATNEARIAKQTFEAVTGVSFMGDLTLDMESIDTKALESLTSSIASSLAQGLEELKNKQREIEDNINLWKNTLVNTFSGIGDALGNAIGMGVTKSLKEGMSIGEAFLILSGKSLLSTLGSLMVELGVMVLAVGEGLKWLKSALMSLDGPAAVAAGLTLITLGAAASAGASYIGRNMGNSSGGYSGGYSSGNVTNDVYRPYDTEYRGLNYAVNFNIGIDELTGVLQVANNKKNRL